MLNLQASGTPDVLWVGREPCAWKFISPPRDGAQFLTGIGSERQIEGVSLCKD